MEKKLRVLHVNDCAGVASNLVLGLRDIGVEAEHIQPTLGTYRARRTVRLSLPIIRTIEAIGLRNYVKKRSFDVVHIHYARFAYMALVTGLPYVLHIHGGDLYLDLYRHGFRELSKLAIRKARQVYYSTPDLEKLLKSIRNDAVFLPNPINLSNFVFSNPNFDPRHARLLSISKLDKRKGVRHIVDAIEQILQACPRLEVAIFSFGDHSAQARAFFDGHKKDPRVIPLSPLPHDEMPELINSASIVLGQQSHDIGALGVTELEAMACGKPVICYFAYPQAYSSSPPVLISRSPAEACDHVLRLLKDPEYCRHIGEESRKWVSSNHELRSVAEKLKDLYLEIL